MGELMKDAAFTYAEARYAAGDFSHMVLQNVSKAQVKIKSRKDNVAGECGEFSPLHTLGF